MFWKKNKKAGEKLTIFFASDLHGSSVCFKKFINGAQFYGASVLIMGGDTTGKAVIPITEQNDGSFLGFQSGADIRLNGRDEVDEFIKRVNNQGFYPIVMTEDEFQALKDDAEAQAQLFKKLVCDRVREWCDFAGDKLKGTEVRFLTSPGNDDFFEIDEIFNGAPHVGYHEMEVTELSGYEILHCGGSTKTPWDTEREYSEEEYQRRFAELVPQVKDMERCIFNVHVPPYGTILDRCPKLDKDLKVVFDMGNPVSMQAGCQALMDTITEQQPLLGLHGHIHEGRGNIKIGRTTCVNPGSVYPEGILQGVLVTLQGGEVASVQLTQG
jgi:Icc-related predicted phosphoesterase